MPVNFIKKLMKRSFSKEARYKIKDIKNPVDAHKSTLIFLHGLGDTGSGWLEQLSKIVPSHMKVICPTAPIIPISLFGYPTNAWFDILSFNKFDKEDIVGIKRSSQFLSHLIDKEHQSGIQLNKILIGGFSQGGAIAYYTTLTSEIKFGGSLILSSWLANYMEFSQYPERWSYNRDIKMFIGHGDSDTLIFPEYMRKSVDILKKIGYNPNVHIYHGLEHCSSSAEISDIMRFIQKIVD